MTDDLKNSIDKLKNSMPDLDGIPNMPSNSTLKSRVTMSIGLRCDGCGAFFILQPHVGTQRDPGAPADQHPSESGLHAGWMCFRHSTQRCQNCQDYERIFLPMNFLVDWRSIAPGQRTLPKHAETPAAAPKNASKPRKLPPKNPSHPPGSNPTVPPRKRR